MKNVVHTNKHHLFLTHKNGCGFPTGFNSQTCLIVMLGKLNLFIEIYRDKLLQIIGRAYGTLLTDV